MTELVAFRAGDAEVIVEFDDDEPGIELVSRKNQLVGTAKHTIDAALEIVRPTVEALARQLRDMDVPHVDRPTEVEVEFGLRLNAEVGAVIARSQAEGHIKVALRWKREMAAKSDEGRQDLHGVESKPAATR